MKKLLFIVLAAVLLVGCGSKKDEEELLEFIEEYNAQANYLSQQDGVPELEVIDEKNIAALEKEDDRYWQLLIKREDFNLKAKYSKGKHLNGYHIYSKGDVAYSDYAIISGIAVAKVLDLDVEIYHEQLTAALNSGEPPHEYTDSGYEISFLLDSDLNVLVINFDKTE